MNRLIASVFAFLLVLFLCSPAPAWNDHGHLVVARVAWNRLTPEQRAKVTAILKAHPHYEEVLTKQKPDGYNVDQWAFMRAACWPDWVRSHHASEYNRSTWHYIDYPFIWPGSSIDPAKHQPQAGEKNALYALAQGAEKVKTGTDVEKAVALCWIFHVVADLHQPLHCTSMFRDDLPTGDRGGNSVQISIRSGPVVLHSFWDGLLGRGYTTGSINKDVVEIEAVMKEKAATVGLELEQHQTPESWAKEGFELCKRAVYLDGQLKLGKSSGRGNRGGDAPPAPEDYAPACGRTARIQVGKAGVRLAGEMVRLVP